MISKGFPRMFQSSPIKLLKAAGDGEFHRSVARFLKFENLAKMINP
jgi:hypothetical protein